MIVREIVCWSLSRSYDRCDFPPNCILFASANSRELRWEPFLTNSNFEIIQTQNFFPLLTRDLPIMPREIVVSWMNYNLLVKTFYLQYFDTIQNSPRSLSFFSKTKKAPIWRSRKRRVQYEGFIFEPHWTFNQSIFLKYEDILIEKVILLHISVGHKAPFQQLCVIVM